MPLAAPVSDGETPARDFLVRAENHGVPQKRHRVFIVGIRNDLAPPAVGTVLLPERGPLEQVSVSRAIADLPALRSRLSREDGPDEWAHAVRVQGMLIARAHDVPEDIRRASNDLLEHGLGEGLPASSRIRRSTASEMPPDLRDWLIDDRMQAILHHETRGHKAEDLGRYLYASIHGRLRDRSPRLPDFPAFLQPDHRSRDSGNFQDRFKVQRAGKASSTITSHIRKDGHYYIHPDPVQARSLTVREAARLQTFPDNYWFCGDARPFRNGTRYHQVGNAVPPYLAFQIANVIRKLLA